MRRLLVAAAIAAGTLTGHGVNANASVPACGELRILYASGVAVGGDAWCAGHASWRVAVGCSPTRYGTATTTRYGPWMTRYESVRYCPSTYRYARWVSYQTTG